MSQFLTPDVESTFAKLVEAVGISGNTEEVSALVESRMRVPGVEFAEDPAGLGTVHAVCNRSAPFRVLLASHMDAVGLRVTYVDNDGYCFVRSVGGIDPLALKGQRVKILSREGIILGLIQGLPMHHSDEAARSKVPGLDQFYVRTPFTGAGDSGKIRVGDPVVFDQPLVAMGEHVLMGPGLDNRLGVLLMTELMRRLSGEKLSIALHALATNGEEIGCRGVRAVAQQIAPQLAIAIDVTTATDYPGANHRKLGHQKLGKGPVLARGYNTRTSYNDLLIETAESENIPFQLRAEDITPTDGRELDEAGLATVVVRVPATNLHTSNDAVDRRDIEATARLLTAFLRRLPVK